MTVETAYVISGLSLAFAVYQGFINIKRNKSSDDKNEASQLTTVIVKLENIGNGVTEIKHKMDAIEKDIKDDHERIIKVEESTKAAHKRMDTCEKFCKRFTPIEEDKIQ